MWQRNRRLTLLRAALMSQRTVLLFIPMSGARAAAILSGMGQRAVLELICDDRSCRFANGGRDAGAITVTAHGLARGCGGCARRLLFRQERAEKWISLLLWLDLAPPPQPLANPWAVTNNPYRWWRGWVDLASAVAFELQCGKLAKAGHGELARCRLRGSVIPLRPEEPDADNAAGGSAPCLVILVNAICPRLCSASFGSGLPSRLPRY